jgi:hypothetical protein
MKLESLLSLFLLLLLAQVQAAPSWEKVYQYAELKDISLDKLAQGEVLGLRTGVDGGQLSLGAESIYLIKKPPSYVLKKKSSFSMTDSGATQNLNLEAHYLLPQPATKAGFQALNMNETNKASRWFLRQSTQSLQEKTAFNLSQAEIHQLRDALKKSGMNQPQSPNSQQAETITETWKEILLGRAQTFQKSGLLGSLPYESGDTSINLGTEMLRALRSRPKVLHAFSGILDPVMTGRMGSTANSPIYSWGRSHIQGSPCISLVAFFSEPSESGYRVAEVNYFVSSVYFSSLILYQLFPVELEGKTNTLVYRADFVLSPSLLRIKGIERIAAENILLMETRQSTKSFIDSCHSASN